MKPGDVVELDGAPFGVVVRTWAERTRLFSWVAGGPKCAPSRRGVALAAEIAPFDPYELDECAPVRLAADGSGASRVIGFLSGRELVIFRRSRSVPRSHKSRQRSSR